MMDDIERLTQRENTLYDQLLAAPVAELTGVVSSRGVGLSKWRGQEQWSLTLSFAAWRIEGGPVRTDSLTVRRRGTEGALKQLQVDIDAETVVRIRGRVSEANVFGSAQAYLEDYEGVVDDDPELETRLAALQQPTTFDDEAFGTFTFDRRVRWYATSATWAGTAINLMLSAETPDEIQSCLSVARELWAQEAAWQTRVQDYAAESLLPLKNDVWLGEEEAEFSADDFKRAMSLEAISVHPEGDLEFWHDDGDLFWGHSILVSGSLADGLTDAGIQG